MEENNWKEYSIARMVSIFTKMNEILDSYETGTINKEDAFDSICNHMPATWWLDQVKEMTK